MDLSRKTLLYYILTTLSIMSLCVVFICVYAANFDGDTTTEYGLTFLYSNIALFLINTILLLALPSSNKSPLKSILVVLISTLFMSFAIAMTEYLFDVWFEHNNGKLISYIKIIFILISFTLLVVFVNFFLSKLTFSSTTKTASEEWEVNNFLRLEKNKARILNTKNASYLYSENKIIILNFVLEDVVERTLNFEYTKEYKKRNEEGEIVIGNRVVPASDIINNFIDIMEKTKKIYDTNIPGAIVYMSNKTPKLIGESKKDIKIIANNEVFKVFKKMNTLDIDIKGKIKELI